MDDDAVFTMRLEHDLHADFLAEADAAHVPAAQVMRDLMRDYIDRQREQRCYAAFLRDKVEAARVSIRDGVGHDQASVEAEFAARRAKAAGPA